MMVSSTVLPKAFSTIGEIVACPVAVACERVGFPVPYAVVAMLPRCENFGVTARVEQIAEHANAEGRTKPLDEVIAFPMARPALRVPELS
jgi:hypothetical protein